MIDITLSFDFELNTSVQVGDVAYYCPTSDGDFTISDSSTIKEIGVIESITPWDGTESIIVCEFDDAVLTDWPNPQQSDFILFSKDSRVNSSSLVGYYGLAKFVNDSTVKGEMFSAACEIFESSK